MAQQPSSRAPSGARTPPAKWILRSSPASPFVRKVRIAAAALGLADRIELVAADLLDPHEPLRLQNPLGKIPCLLLEDGTALQDSRVIVEYLDSLGAPLRLIPAAGPERFRALARAALADGICDAAILIVYEGRYHEAQGTSAGWLEHQRGKLERGLAAFAAAPPDPATTDVVSIGLACALGYLDLRKQLDWRPRYPVLVAWLARFAAAQPAFAETG